MTNKKSYKSSPAAYPDCQKVMEMALENPGLIVRFNTVGRAVNFKQRCYRYRTALRELLLEQQGDIPGLPIETPYDAMIIKHVERKRKPDSNVLYTTSEVLQFTFPDMEFDIELPDGTRGELPQASSGLDLDTE